MSRRSSAKTEEWRRLSSPPAPRPTLLAEQLTQEKQYGSAAIEYRRLAISATEEDEKAGYFWGAAYIYHLNHDETLAVKMLDFSEGTSNIYEQETTLLRLDCAIAEKDMNEADFYAQSLEQSATNKLKYIAQSRRAKLAVMNHKKNWKMMKSFASLRPSLSVDPLTNQPSIGIAMSTKLPPQIIEKTLDIIKELKNPVVVFDHNSCNWDNKSHWIRNHKYQFL